MPEDNHSGRLVPTESYMIVVRRTLEESVTLNVGDKKVVVKVLAVKGCVVRLGVEADSTVLVERFTDEEHEVV